jgi:6-phosphofructokinase
MYISTHPQLQKTNYIKIVMILNPATLAAHDNCQLGVAMGKKQGFLTAPCAPAQAAFFQ